MHLIDTHAHLSHIPKKDRKAVIDRANKCEISKLITVSCKLDEVVDNLELAKKDKIWATVGIHPTELTELKDLEKVKEIASKEDKIVAIGEIGIDYYHDRFPHDLQAEFFRKQLEIAHELGLPAIIHCRGGKNPGENEKAFIDMIQILEEEQFSNGVVHCFSGNQVEADKIMDLGLMISFTNIISYGSNEGLRDVIKSIPLPRIMLETDSPYISKEPTDVIKIAKKISEIQGVPYEEVVKITTENAERFFGI